MGSLPRANSRAPRLVRTAVIAAALVVAGCFTAAFTCVERGAVAPAEQSG